MEKAVSRRFCRRFCRVEHEVVPHLASGQQGADRPAGSDCGRHSCHRGRAPFGQPGGGAGDGVWSRGGESEAAQDVEQSAHHAPTLS